MLHKLRPLLLPNRPLLLLLRPKLLLLPLPMLPLMLLMQLMMLLRWQNINASFEIVGTEVVAKKPFDATFGLQLPTEVAGYDTEGGSANDNDDRLEVRKALVGSQLLVVLVSLNPHHPLLLLVMRGGIRLQDVPTSITKTLMVVNSGLNPTRPGTVVLLMGLLLRRS